MSQGNKSSRTDKQQREAEPIEAGGEKKVTGTKTAEARLWAAANKLTHESEERSGGNKD
jgi:hypothetical protein